MGSISFDDQFAHNMDEKQEPMAIVGMATRFPQSATSSEELWKLLLQGRSAHGPFPEDRINPAGHYHPDPEHGGTFAVKGGHFLSEDPAGFDAPFFSITKSEVMSLDPQQRIVLENVFHALENAGLPMGNVTSSNTSVYVSGFNHDHLANLNTDPEITLKYKPLGTTNSLLSNRVSWFFDFKGPSLTLDTACSSSMVALHLACQSLRDGESDMSVVSGVTLVSFPIDVLGMSHHGFLSKEGKCFSFDHRADGYARGEGVGSVIVKRLSDAVKDGNTIRAVIRGCGVNQDGRTPGISLPSSAAQESLMRKVYASAGLGFQDTHMVEAHGTGTAAGDPIEASAIARTFASRSREIPLFIGAIKSNVGHLEGGAGIAGIIKSILVLENGIIPANLNFEQVNAKIPMEKWNIQFPLRCTPWPVAGLRRISVNSFGVGGTNGHAILDDAYHYLHTRGLQAKHNTNPKVPTSEEINLLVSQIDTTVSQNNNTLRSDSEVTYVGNGVCGEQAPNTSHADQHHGMTDGIKKGKKESSPVPQLIVLTSFDEAGIKRIAKVHSAYLGTIQPPRSSDEAAFLKNFAYTMARKRTIFPWRSFLLADSFSQLTENLDSAVSKPVRARSQIRLGFVFTGQGAQWYAMGRELMVYPIFRKSLEEATTYMQTIGAKWSLMEELLRGKAESNINQPFLAHPACTALQVALIDLLASWGIRPNRVIGHSSGEIAAAYCAGRLSREAAWKTSYFRGYVSNKQLKAKGAMLAVGISAAELQPFLKQVNRQDSGEVVIACFNGPRSNTVSGDEHIIDALKDALTSNGLFARKLLVMNAYHSAHMKEVADEYRKLLGDLSASYVSSVSEVEMFSSVTGGRIESDHLDSAYWVNNLVQPVRFTDALNSMCFTRTKKSEASLRMNTSASNIFVDTIIEVGPHAALQSAIKETVYTRVDSSTVTCLALLNRSTPGLSTLLETIGKLNSIGYPLDVQAVNESSSIVNSKLQGSSPEMLVHLPGYAFNHSERLLYESRLSRNYRLRKYPRHDLFGAPVPDWNAEAPRWRHILRLSEQPWIRDHVVTGAFVYPGVGYLIMALEASRQIADQKLVISGFRLRDICLKRALIVPDNKEGVETCLALTRMDESSLWGSSVWRKFQISSYNPVGDDWIEHCTGYIATDYETAAGPIDRGREAEAETAFWKEALKTVSERCVKPLEMENIYENLVTTGLTFGPLFKNLANVKGTTEQTGEVLGMVTVPKIADAMPKGYAHEYLIHPATMDSMMHLFLASALDRTGKKTLERPMVPTFIKDVWVSANVSPEPGQQFHGYGKSKYLAYDKYEADVMIWDAFSNEGRISIKGIRSSPLESIETESGALRKLCHEIEWTPYLELLAPAALSDVCLTSDEENLEYREWITKLQHATLLLVTDALDELERAPLRSLEGHYIKYFKWMQQLREWLKVDKINGICRSDWERYAKDPALKQQLLEDVSRHNADGKLAVRMGTNIVRVLRKEVDPLDLMFGQDDILNHVYEQVVKLGDLPALQKAYFSIVRKNCTHIKILEIGAGTGSSTAAILESLEPVSEGVAPTTSSISRYTFTDISSAFFEKAKEKFKNYRDVIEFKTLDVEQDATKQGFEASSYDFIIAGNVVHATADLKNTLGNLRKLLKPGGRLVLQEGIRQDYFWSTIAFGQLPGWWMGVESIRQWSPWISTSQWDSVLKDAGFTGIDLDLKDRRDPTLHTQSVLIATAVGNTTQDTYSTNETVIVTTTPTSEGQSSIVQALKTRLVDCLGLEECRVVHYLDLASTELSRSVCISVVELERPVLSKINEEEFNNIRQMLCICKGLLWVTPDMVTNPEYSLIVGLLRTVRWERDIDEVNLATLSICDAPISLASLAESIGVIYKQQFHGTLTLGKMNGEYLLKDGIFMTSRLVDAENANTYLASKFIRRKPEMKQLQSAGRPIKLATAAPGLLDKLEWVTDSVYKQPLGDTQVEIDIKAVGLNFRDLMIAMGEHMAYSMGNEAAGVVSRVGSKVQDFKAGDRVVYMCGLESTGCFHTFGRVDQNVVVHIPDNLSYEIAASLPCVYSTVIYGLQDAGRLEKGEKILIHAAAGGVGQAAINLSKSIGAEIFCTVSSPEKKELLMTEYGIPEDHIFSSRDLTFVKGVMRMTQGKGVDVVLNSLSGEALRRSWDLLAPFGRFVEIGKKDAQANGKVELHPFLRNVTMTSVELPTMMRHRPQLIKRLTQDTVRLYEKGIIKEAVPTNVMSYSQIEQGLRVLQSGKGMGKMVFKPNPNDIVPIVPAETPPYQLSSEASYVLAGGLGGIGRSMARWMVGRGARYLIFLSKSGKITKKVEQMVSELESQGCCVRIFVCDVSQKARLADVLEECSASWPPIKGVIQGAMMLKDGMFENMTHETFQLAVKPKVQGSWNLHELLPRDMDFFVMLSSATGVLGNRSQANYASGNTYQDFLAQYRRSQGLPASTIDLGTVLSVGYVAENSDRTIVAKHLSTVLEVIREDEIHTLLEYLMDARCAAPAQIVSGLSNAETYRQRGAQPPTYLSYPLFTHLRSITASRSGGSDQSGGLMVEALLNAATTLEEATEIITNAVRTKLSALLAMPVENIDPTKSVSSNGVDSLVAMEFRTYLSKELKADIPLLDIMGTNSIEVLCKKIGSISSAVDIRVDRKKE